MRARASVLFALLFPLVTARLFAPPSNDNFADRSSISTSFYFEAGSFSAGFGDDATREAGEPACANNLGASVWYTWTCPPGSIVGRVQLAISSLTSSNVATIPDICVFTNDTLQTLGRVSTASKLVGFTRLINFKAYPGITYQFLLAGNLPYLDDKTSFYLTLNFSSVPVGTANLATNLVACNALGDCAVNFAGNARVENLLPLTSNPLRLRLIARRGFSSSQFSFEDGAEGVTNRFIGIFPVNNYAPLRPFQAVLVPIQGSCPAPTHPADELGYGWNVHSILEEKLGNAWGIIDRTLVLAGDWPALNGVSGPGGGVIRFDPNLGNGQAPATFVALRIIGPTQVKERSRVTYLGRATVRIGATDSVVPVAGQWFCNVPTMAMATGVYQAPVVAANRSATVTFRANVLGRVRTVQLPITILNTNVVAAATARLN